MSREDSYKEPLVQDVHTAMLQRSEITKSNTLLEVGMFFYGTPVDCTTCCQARMSHKHSPLQTIIQRRKSPQQRIQRINTPQQRIQRINDPQQRKQRIKAPRQRIQLIKDPQHRIQRINTPQTTNTTNTGSTTMKKARALGPLPVLV